MKIYHIAQMPNLKLDFGTEYLLENGMLYDDDAEDVFSIGELGEYHVPLFRSADDANAFLEKLETQKRRIRRIRLQRTSRRDEGIAGIGRSRHS